MELTATAPRWNEAESPGAAAGCSTSGGPARGGRGGDKGQGSGRHGWGCTEGERGRASLGSFGHESTSGEESGNGWGRPAGGGGSPGSSGPGGGAARWTGASRGSPEQAAVPARGTVSPWGQRAGRRALRHAGGCSPAARGTVGHAGQRHAPGTVVCGESQALSLPLFVFAPSLYLSSPYSCVPLHVLLFFLLHLSGLLPIPFFLFPLCRLSLFSSHCASVLLPNPFLLLLWLHPVACTVLSSISLCWSASPSFFLNSADEEEQGDGSNILVS